MTSEVAMTLLVGALASVSCGGSQTEPTTVEPVAEPAAEDELLEPPVEEQEVLEEDEALESEEAALEPEFEPGMSVAEARAAVPRDGDHFLIDHEALAAPLLNPELYSGCELQGHHRFQMEVAIWQGKAVGIDLEANDETFGSCLRKAVEGLEWPDRVASLNTVEYAH